MRWRGSGSQVRSFFSVSDAVLTFSLTVSLDMCRRQYGIRMILLPGSRVAQQALQYINSGETLLLSLDITKSPLLPRLWSIGLPHLHLMATALFKDYHFYPSACLVFAVLRLITIHAEFDTHVNFVSALQVFLGNCGKMRMSGAMFAAFFLGLSLELEILFAWGNREELASWRHFRWRWKGSARRRKRTSAWRSPRHRRELK